VELGEACWSPARCQGSEEDEEARAGAADVSRYPRCCREVEAGQSGERREVPRAGARRADPQLPHHGAGRGAEADRAGTGLRAGLGAVPGGRFSRFSRRRPVLQAAKRSVMADVVTFQSHHAPVARLDNLVDRFENFGLKVAAEFLQLSWAFGDGRAQALFASCNAPGDGRAQALFASCNAPGDGRAQALFASCNAPAMAARRLSSLAVTSRRSPRADSPRRSESCLVAGSPAWL